VDIQSLGDMGDRMSDFGIGCEQIGGQAWGGIPVLNGVRPVQQAFGAGITTFQTAEVYGNRWRRR